MVGGRLVFWTLGVLVSFVSSQENVCSREQLNQVKQCVHDMAGKDIFKGGIEGWQSVIELGMDLDGNKIDCTKFRTLLICGRTAEMCVLTTFDQMSKIDDTTKHTMDSTDQGEFLNMTNGAKAKFKPAFLGTFMRCLVPTYEKWYGQKFKLDLTAGKRCLNSMINKNETHLCSKESAERFGHLCQPADYYECLRRYMNSDSDCKITGIHDRVMVCNALSYLRPVECTQPMKCTPAFLESSSVHWLLDLKFLFILIAKVLT
ncbi:hypothetical protein M3Y95_00352700 [Aphelenchoides besseyi]|nr:hypothetical protein M3Y95_00352700 [Aphelenchoides besseyi]